MKYFAILLTILLAGCYQTADQYQARPMYWQPPPPPVFQAPHFGGTTNCYRYGNTMQCQSF